MRIEEIKVKTLIKYKEVRHTQLNDGTDKFIDGLECAYRLTLKDLGYSEKTFLSQEYCHNEILRLEKKIRGGN